MESVAHLLETFEEAVELAYDSNLEPDPKRSDWGSHRLQLDELTSLYEKTLIPALDDVRDELDDRIISALETRAAYIGLGVFAALHASGQSGRALPFFATVVDRVRDKDSGPLFASLARDTTSAIELARLRHRLANGFVTARPEFKRLAKATREKAISEEALEMFHAPQPLTSAPGLGTLNGFGTGLYGSRDRDSSDNSEVKTLCISALYIPIFPLKAYRVIDHGDGSYSFMSKNRLSGFARTYQKLLAASIALLIGYFAVSSYLNSPDRLARKALAAADASRDAGEATEAIKSYDRLIERWAFKADTDTIETAAKNATALRIAAVPSPLTVAELDAALLVVGRYRTYPLEAKSNGNNAFVVDQVLAWTDELGSDTTETMNAAIALLDGGIEVAASRQGEIDDKRRSIKTKLAKELAPRRPIEALSMLVELGADDETAALVEKITDNPSLLREAAPALDRWLAGQARGVTGTQLREALETAREPLDDEERKAALAGDDVKALNAALAKYPGDHELVVALAELDRASGNAAAAIKRLTALGEPGWLTGSAQQTLAAAYADDNDLARADTILSELLRFRQPAFRKAASAYYSAGDQLRERLIQRADSGSAPPAVMSALRAGNDATAQAAFGNWVAEEMSKDTRLGALKHEFELHVYVVPASITLGTIKLRRANTVAGGERDALLAEAEAAFLSISDDAVGLPSYHLGLGQVYHRLGKVTEGDAEFEGLLARGEPQLSLQVSRSYRELGLNARAIEIGKKVFQDSASPMREAAAHHLSYIVDELDEKEEWLKKSDSSSPAVKISLTEVQARRAAERGDEAEAAKLFRKTAKYYERDAEHNSIAANNAAVAYLEIYSVTGDAKQLPKARKGLESSLRLEPGNALVVSNLAGHCQFEGWLEVVGKYVPIQALRLERSDLETIAAMLARGELRETILSAAKKNSILRRGRELTAQELVLAPSRVGGWQRAADWASMLHDGGALDNLLAQVGRAKLDTSSREAAMAKFIAGESDADAIENKALAVTRYQEMIAAAKKKRSKRGEAVARYLLGVTLAQSGWSQAKVELIDNGIAELQTASKLWPALGDSFSRASIQAAVLRVGAKSAPVREMREANWRQHGVTTMLAVAMAGDDGDAITSALAGDSELKAIARRLAGQDAAPSLSLWMLGKLTGNRDVEQRGAQVFTQSHQLTGAKLGTRFSPTSPRYKVLESLFEKRGTL